MATLSLASPPLAPSEADPKRLWLLPPWPDLAEALTSLGAGLCNLQVQGLSCHRTDLWESKDRRETTDTLPLYFSLQWTVLTMLFLGDLSTIIPYSQATSCVPHEIAASSVRHFLCPLSLFSHSDYPGIAPLNKVLVIQLYIRLLFFRESG